MTVAVSAQVCGLFELLTRSTEQGVTLAPCRVGTRRWFENLTRNFSQRIVMQLQTLPIRDFAAVAGAAILAFSGWVSAGPCWRVARFGYLSGRLSFLFAGDNDCVQAPINRPLITRGGHRNPKQRHR